MFTRCRLGRRCSLLLFGRFFGFATPRSYLPLHQLFDDIGFLLPNGYVSRVLAATAGISRWHSVLSTRFCRRTDSLFEGLFCPSGYHKLPDELFGCNTTCPATYVHPARERLPRCSSCGVALCSYVCTCRACRKDVKASLLLSNSFILLGQVESEALTISIPTQPLRDVIVTMQLTMSGGAPVSVVASTSQLTFTPTNWETPQSVLIALVPNAVQHGDVNAALFFEGGLWFCFAPCRACVFTLVTVRCSCVGGPGFP